MIESKKHKYDFPSISLGKEKLDEIKNIVAEHGGIYINGLCMIRSVEQKTTTRKFVDGIISKEVAGQHMAKHIKFYRSRTFADDIRKKAKNKTT